MRVVLPVDGARLSLWRAVAIFRIVALAVCVFLIVQWHHLYARPDVAVVVGAAMMVVTGVVIVLAVRGQAHRPTVVVLDVVVTGGLTLATIAAQTPTQQHGGMVTLTTIWAAGPTIEAAFVAGPIAGVVAGVFQYGFAFAVRGGYAGETLFSGIVLVLVGLVVGLTTTYTVRAEDELRAVSSERAALAERERLARSIHDGVLQVLGLVHRTGRDAGAPWDTLAAAAAEQEAALRGLLTSSPAPNGTAVVRDLAEELRGLRSDRVTVSLPAESVPLPTVVAGDFADAVRAALHNVADHAGDAAHAWVLLETLDDAIRVTVRDDGVGFGPHRLDEAAADGRMGVARSMRGRVIELGGRCTITSAPGEGTEVEMTVPR